MVTSIDIKKVSSRGKVVIDLDVWMNDPNDHEFSPRITLSGNSIELRVPGHEDLLASIELDDDALQLAERDRVVEARIKFNVHGMHGTLTHRTPNPRSGPKSKKLAEPRWKVMLPLQ
ncbi:MAG: hypothetical protein QF612_02580 [Candidatus Thalassarchaeaceae archaeon]|mgnify:CR=1 FL=1|jgi:hypothetical protein|nr:hypothetical protein [Candidatus Thalassarchaeaceae archaeon]